MNLHRQRCCGSSRGRRRHQPGHHFADESVRRVRDIDVSQWVRPHADTITASAKARLRSRATIAKAVRLARAKRRRVARDLPNIPGTEIKEPDDARAVGDIQIAPAIEGQLLDRKSVV